MPEIAVKGHVTRDGRIEATAPEGFPEGEVELVIRTIERRGDPAALIRLIKERAASGCQLASKAEIDARLQAERESWE